MMGQVAYYTLNLWDYDQIVLPKGLPTEWTTICICTSEDTAEKAAKIGFTKTSVISVSPPGISWMLFP